VNRHAYFTTHGLAHETVELWLTATAARGGRYGATQRPIGPEALPGPRQLLRGMARAIVARTARHSR